MQAKEQQYRILFIGNSYTYYNHMPEEIFAATARAAGFENVEVSSITKGGYYLGAHADAADEIGAQVDQALRENVYDYVVLQEQSVCPASDPERFFDNARAIVRKVRANGAKPVFYCTWGRREGNDVLAQHGWTNESMTRRLAQAYTRIGDELDAQVAYAGPAFYEIHSKFASRIELYAPDGSHPSPAGSYLAALTIFAKIFRADPVCIGYNGPLPAEDALLLKQAAKAAAEM